MEKDKIRIDVNFDEKKSFKNDIIKYFAKIISVCMVIALITTRILSSVVGNFFLDSSNSEQLNKIFNIILVFNVVLFFVITVVIMYFVKKYIAGTTRLLNGLRLHIGYLSKGVYHYKIKEKYLKREDEVGHICIALDHLQSTIKYMVEDMKKPTNTMTEQSISLGEISNDLSEATAVVSNEINNIVDGIVDESKDIELVVNNISKLNQIIVNAIIEIENLQNISSNVHGNAQTSNEDLRMVTNSLEDFTRIFNEFLIVLNSMNTNIKEVNEISDLINNVAEQTNLLALNAAIEAARAGEAGRGFTVVAEEIRKLSDKTKQSSISINRLITNVLENSNSLANNTAQMTDKLQSQKDGIRKSRDSFKTISESITEIDNMAISLSKSSKEINEKQDEITQKVELISSVNQSILSSIQEIAASSEQTKETSKTLLGYAGSLKENAEINSKHINSFVLVGVDEEE